MHIILVANDGSTTDVTEAVQITYDALVGSMDYGSGFLGVEELEALSTLAQGMGATDAADVAQNLFRAREAYRKKAELDAEWVRKVQEAQKAWVEYRVVHPDGDAGEVWVAWSRTRPDLPAVIPSFTAPTPQITYTSGPMEPR